MGIAMDAYLFKVEIKEVVNCVIFGLFSHKWNACYLILLIIHHQVKLKKWLKSKKEKLNKNG
jgi:hypothetical protein